MNVINPIGLLSVFLVFIVGCSEEVAVIDVAEPKTAPRTELRILSWSEYIAPSVIEKFTREFGIDVVQTAYEDQEEVVALLKAANYKNDLVITPKAIVKRLRDTGAIRKLDLDRLTGLENLNQTFRGLDVDPENEYSVPYFWGGTVIAYRSDLVPAQPKESLEALFDPALAGKTAVITDHMERFALANKYRGVSVNARSPEELERSSKVLSNYAMKYRGQFLGDQEIRDQLKSGELWLAHCFNGDAAMIAKDEPSIRYFIPKEGSDLWIDLIVMPREAKNSEAAYAFLNFLNRPEINAENANFVCFATPNEAAISLIDKELLEDEAIYLSKKVLAKCEFFRNVMPEDLKMMSVLSKNHYPSESQRVDLANQDGSD